jgi:hypothetical protein
MKQINIVVVMAAILAVLLMSGCTSSPEKGASNQSTSAAGPENDVKYVQINLLDGTSVGGKYVSETAAFTTINIIYTLNPEAYTFYNNSYDSYVKDPDKYIMRANGAEIAIKNDLIDTMVTIDDPEQVIAKAQQEVKDEIAAAQNAYEEKMKKAMIEKYEAERAKYEPSN